MASGEHRDLAFYPCKPLDFKAAVINKVCSGCKKYHNYVLSPQVRSSATFGFMCQEELIGQKQSLSSAMWGDWKKRGEL